MQEGSTGDPVAFATSTETPIASELESLRAMVASQQEEIAGLKAWVRELQTPDSIQVLRHEYGGSPDKVRIKLERNSKGINWEISATGATVDETLALIAEAKAKVEGAYS